MDNILKNNSAYYYSCNNQDAPFEILCNKPNIQASYFYIKQIDAYTWI